MRELFRFFMVSALLTSSVALAAERHRHRTAPQQESPPTSSSESFDGNMAWSMERMHAGMAAARATGNPDRDFLAAMLPHHQGAIDMAKAVLLVTKDPRVRNLAQSIITGQQYEIELMKVLLAEPGEKAP